MPSRTAPDRFASAPEADVGSSRFAALSGLRARRRLIVFCGIAIAAYLVGIVALMPASLVVRNRPWRTGVSGTIWNGEAGLAGGSVLRWHFAPLRSLTSLAFAVDWRATGANTDLSGRALYRPGRTLIDHVGGFADASLIKAVQPLPFDCSLNLHIDMPKIAIGGASGIEGQIASDAGSCGAPGGSATPLAPLLLTAQPLGDETRIRLAPMAQRRRELMTATLKKDGTISITMTKAGAAALPFAGLPGGATIEGQF